MASYQILYWHDIPVQVKAREGRARASRELPARFMEAVDKAAMASKSVDNESYTAVFIWGDSLNREGTPDEVCDAVMAELDAQYVEIDHRATAQRIKDQRKQDSA